MTAIASFYSISEAGKKTLHMLSDSRITWGTKDSVIYSYDYSQKIFHLDNSLDVFGYCGDSLFCLINLSQIVSYLNNSTIFVNSNSFTAKSNMIYALLDDSLKTYPEETLVQDFTIYWNCLVNDIFYSHGFAYSKDSRKITHKNITFPTEMKWIFYDGSGGKYYFKALENLNYSDYNFSRTYFKALVDIIESGIDPKTGGPPQMISIRMEEKDIQSISIIYQNKYYLYGIEDKFVSNSEKVEYRDLDFSFYTPDGTLRSNFKNSFIRKQNLEDWKNNILIISEANSGFMQ